jgi:hypothetical protein
LAEIAKKCIECSRPLEMSAGLIIDGDAYHTRCWEQTRLARSTVPPYDQTRSGAPKRRLGRRKP